MVATVCPACEGRNPYVRTSRPLSKDVSELYIVCTNPKCRCVFVALIEAVRIVGESLLPENEHNESYKALPRANERFLARYRRHIPTPPEHGCTDSVHRSAQESAQTTIAPPPVPLWPPRLRTGAQKALDEAGGRGGVPTARRGV
ncbi:ogr/Delta-like zinc finger family protein [Zoogloea sp. LCSB751]|uniref:ogr/Delta-like zinc finger family protein n=1 Tax=Zoogloea sp. LCSB751 TaxID=1965277 RepID=UPI0009A4CC5E